MVQSYRGNTFGNIQVLILFTSLLSSAELASASGAYVVLSSSLTFSSKHVRLGKIVVYYFSNGYYLTDDKVKCNLLLAPTINHI